MFFRVQNLGPLRDAEVDLSKDLIVLAGPNNSGKTYLAWSVYGLHRFGPRANAIIDRWAQQILTPPEYALDLSKLSGSEGIDLLEAITDEYQSRLHLCFSAEKAQFSSTDISLKINTVPRAVVDEKNLSITPYGPNRTLALYRQPDSNHLHIALVEGNHIDAPFTYWDRLVLAPADSKNATSAVLANMSADELDNLGSNTKRILQHYFISRLFPHCRIFPAERIAVNIFAKELALKRTELVDELVDADIDEKRDVPLEFVRRRVGRYPWPIRDSLRVANDLSSLSKNISPLVAFANELEAAVLGGAVNVADTGEMLFAPHVAKEMRLGVHLTASVVKSLSSLVFYFRHLAQHGDFIIIDEPELNLHPDNQRKITRILAKAIQWGLKIMISTHSDYVLRELNHLIMLSKLPAEEAKAMGYDPESALDPNRVGVYLFDQQHSESVPVSDTGFSIRTIDAVVNQLNADEQRLYARLAE